MHISPFIAPLLIAIASIPLFLRKIPRNPMYGLRTRASMSSDEQWYKANKIAGLAGIVGGGLWLVAVLVLPKYGVPIGYATLIGLGVTVLMAGIAANRAH